MSGYDLDELHSEHYPPYWPGILAVAILGFLLHALFATQHGYFRDELYYLACADNLAWGYVDHPPLSIFILKVSTAIFGDNLWGVRLPGFFAGIGITVLFGLLARECGADERGQILSSVFGAFAPVIMVVTHLYSMNGLDIFLTAWAVLVWLRARQEHQRNRWILLGVILGFAILNKISILLVIAGLLLATLLTPRRREFTTWHPYAGVLIALLIASPFALWLSTNNFITLEFIRNATQIKMNPVPPAQFFLTQAVVVNPFLFLVALVGTVVALTKRPYRPQVIAFAVVLAVLVAGQKTRENYLAPAYALVVPVGAQALSKWFEDRRALRWVYFALLGLSSAALLAIALPALPPKTFIQLTGNAAEAVPSAERGKKSPLQGHADMFGWPEMAQTARAVWLTLPPEKRPKAPVLGINYGQSSAVWFFNQDQDGPPVIGVHNNWWLWGPEPWDGEVLVTVGYFPDDYKAMFESFEPVAYLNEPYAVPEESQAPVSIARGLKVSVQDFWAKTKQIQ